MNRQSAAISLVLLAAAALATLLTPPAGVTYVKLAGAGLAVVAVAPVFLMLFKVMKTGSLNRILAILVGGFFFKLAVVLVGVWQALTRLDWNTLEFVAGCMAFLFALQAAEALFFWGRNQVG